MMDGGEAEAEVADVTPALHSVHWAPASRDAHLFGIKSISPGECGFPAAKTHFQSGPRCQGRSFRPEKGAGAGSRSISWRAQEPPQPHLRAQAAVHVGWVAAAVRQREVAGLGLGLSGDPRPLNFHPPAPALPGSPGALGP